MISGQLKKSHPKEIQPPCTVHIVPYNSNSKVALSSNQNERSIKRILWSYVFLSRSWWGLYHFPLLGSENLSHSEGSEIYLFFLFLILKYLDPPL